MNQLELQYIYTWKYHKETPWTFISNKNVIFFLFFFYKIGEQEGETGPAWGSRNRWERGDGREKR
jgi:hypothetical protein